MSKIVKAYLHSSKESMRDLAEEIGLSEEAQDEFKYALYEVEFDLEVQDNGSYSIVKVNGRDLAPASPPVPSQTAGFGEFA